MITIKIEKVVKNMNGECMHTRSHSRLSTKYAWPLNIRKMLNLTNNQNKANYDSIIYFLAIDLAIFL